MGVFEQKRFDKDIEVVKKELVHDGFLQVKKYDLKQLYFNGDWSSLYSREFIDKPQAVAVLPYDPVLDKVVLIEQFRIGAFGRSKNPWLIEVIAGIKDSSDEEAYEDLAKRELLEEAGLESKNLFLVYDYFSSSGCSNEKIKMYCAEVDSTKAPKFSGLKYEQEDIRVHVVSTKDAFDAVRTGRINNAFAIIALQWLELNLKKGNMICGRVI